MNRKQTLTSNNPINYLWLFIFIVFLSPLQGISQSCIKTNTINIGTGYDPLGNVLSGQKDSNWIVTAMSSQMQNALCYGSSLSVGAPPSSTLYQPVPLNQYSYIGDVGGFVSCYPYVTIYTKNQPTIPNSGAFEYTMNVRRNFYVASANATETVFFNFNITCDDAIDSVIIDKGTPNEFVILSTLTKTVGAGVPFNVSNTIPMKPGVHTIDIKCADWQDPIGGTYFPITVNGQTDQYQWNPFGVKIVGTITSPNSILQNKICCTATYKTIDTTICQGKSFLGHSTAGQYKDTILNAAGCDSIITTNLTLSQNCACNSLNSLNISTGYNSDNGSFLTAGQRDNNWIVTAISNDMKNAFCNSNTSSPVQATGTTTLPVNIGEAPWVIKNYPSPWIQTDRYLSCFAYNTMHTVTPAATNVTNCTMTIKRDFYINGNTNQNITFNFHVSSDDATNSVVIDAGTPNAITLYSAGGFTLNPPLQINVAHMLAPGNHTLTIVTANQEDIAGTYFNLPSGQSAQWNPFGVAVSGTITATNNILLNKPCCTATTNTIDTTICQGKNFLGHTTSGNYKDTILNATGCDSIITLKLTVKQINVDAGKDSTICTNSTITLYATGTNITAYAWTPKLLLNDSTLQNPLAHIDNTVKFYIKAKDNSGCTVIDSVTYTVQIPKVVTNNDTAICKGTSLQLNTTGATTYSWKPATDLSVDNISNPIASPSINTQYIVTGTTALGCKANDTINITVHSLPIVKVNNDTTICKGIPLQLNAAGALTYKWNTNYKLTDINIGNPIATPDIPTQYFVIGTDINKCSANDTVNINVQTKPNIQLIKDSTICKNVPIQLFASGANKYQWTPSASLDNAAISNPIASPVSNTTYYLTTTDNSNCSYVDSVKITIKQIPIFSVSPDKNICSNNQQIQLSASGGDSYSWTPATLVSNPNSSNPFALNTTTTIFSVNIKETKCNYQTDLSTTVKISPAIKITVSKSNDIDCFNRSAKLIATGADTYSWSPATGLDNPNSSTPTATLLSPQKYTLTGSTVNGCVGYETITINTTFNTLPNYFIPNAFTPNNDGLNDCFIIPYLGGIKEFHIAIYNRLGNLVFESANPSACWDGIYKGLQAEAGNYVYHVSITSDCGNFVKKGNLVLIR